MSISSHLAILGLAMAAVLPAAGAAADPEGSTFYTFDISQMYDFDFDFYPTRLALGDLDADGAAELVVSGRNVEGLVAILPGLGTPGNLFGEPTFISVGVQTNAVVLHDLDGDGTLDMILAVRSTPGRIIILDGAGDGTFAGRRDLPMLREVADVVVHDVDGDGDPDLVCTGYGTHDLVVFRNDGAGGFSAAERLPLGLALRAPARPFWIETGDLDGDAIDDYVVSLFGSGHLSISKGGVGPGAGPGLARRIPLGTPTGIRLADLDGDGDLDILTPTWAFPDGMLTVLENDGDANFTRLDFPITGFYLWGMAAPDIDADGRPEPLISEALTARFTVLPNESTPAGIAFGPRQNFTIGGFPWHVLTAFVDDDCAIDLIVCDIAEHRIQLYLNTTPQVACGLTDLDGDGRNGIMDAMIVLAEWGRGGGIADVDRDGVVGPLDLLRVTASWELSR